MSTANKGLKQHWRAFRDAFDTLNAVRRTVVWGRSRDDDPRPPDGHRSFAEHDAIVAAIADRDMAAAADGMRRHLQVVQALLLAENRPSD